MDKPTDVNILDLPTEILIKIFAFLNCFDVLKISMVCQRFRDIFAYPKSSSKVLLKFRNLFSMEQCPIETVFENNLRAFPNVSIDESNMNLFYEYLLKRANIFELIELHKLEISTDQFFKLLERTEHLNELRITKCAFVENSKPFEFQKSYLKLKTLSYLKAPHSSINSYRRLLTHIDTEYLENIKISLLKNPSEHEHNCCCAFLEPLIIIKLRSLEVHNLQFNCCKWKLFNILESNRHILSNLIICQCNIINDSDVVTIAKKMTNLKGLALKCCFHLTNVSAYALEKLDKLEKLTISECSGILSGINSAGLKNGIAKNVSLSLSELNLIHIDINTACMIKISKSLPNLQTLVYQYPITRGRIGCKITDFAVQAIINNLKLLKKLELMGCSWVTDFGVTGFCDETDANDELGYSLNILKNLETLNLVGSDKVTDSFILNEFDLIKLRILRIPKLNIEAMKVLIEKCIFLEEIEFQCDNNTDELIIVAINSFHMLKSIKVKRFCFYCKHKLVIETKKYNHYVQNIEMMSGCMICCCIITLCEHFQKKP